ncbi:retroviral-like aspartic protease family protein [candidate division KSB1 bacterium]|nr:retroviral-like aspartic protease family protein [candidate division KSB1 bacterium]
MKIRGYWGRFDAPFVKAQFACKKFGINEIVDFMVDLGASCTIISDKDAQALGIDYASLQKLRKGVSGIGGQAKTYLLEEIELYFKSDLGLHRANMDHVFVIKQAHKRGPEVLKLIPSILGRDFLNQMALLVDKRNNLVLITDEVLTV